jgi:hypothetical protein
VPSYTCDDLRYLHNDYGDQYGVNWLWHGSQISCCGQRCSGIARTSNSTMTSSYKLRLSRISSLSLGIRRTSRCDD